MRARAMTTLAVALSLTAMPSGIGVLAAGPLMPAASPATASLAWASPPHADLAAPEGSPAPSAGASASQFPWPTLPPPRHVPLPRQSQPSGRPDATRTRDGVKVELWLSSPSVAPGEWVQAVVRTTNVGKSPTWYWPGECWTSGTRVRVDLSAIVPQGQPQSGNAATLKKAALAGELWDSFAHRRDARDGTVWPGDGRIVVECTNVTTAALSLKPGATREERFAWYPAHSYDGETWFQPLPPGPIEVTVSWPYVGRGERPKVQPGHSDRAVDPIEATATLQVTGAGPGTPSLADLVDIALVQPSFRAWVDAEPPIRRMDQVSVLGWPGPTYEHHLFLASLKDAPRTGVLSIELDRGMDRGIVFLDPWTGEVLDVPFLWPHMDELLATPSPSGQLP
jgi:hypothetical protein